MSDWDKNQISDEVDALLRFYRGRKLISVSDIVEFSKTYKIVQRFMPPKE